MIPRTTLSALVLAAAALPAAAQDSVSKHNMLPGDALDAHQANEQIANYIVDQTVFRSSWGRVYGVAPLIKASENFWPDPVEFTHLISAQSLSNTTLRNVPFASNLYSLWSMQGSGVNTDPNANDPGALIPTTGFVGSQFSAAFAEFGGNNDNVVSGVVNYLDNLPSRLFVSRVSSAQNAPDYTCALASVALGGIDSHGNVHIRADDFGLVPCGAGTPILGNNYFRVDNLLRAASTNILSGTGGSDAGATSWPLMLSGTTHATPTIIPEQVHGTRPILIGSNFNSQYVYEAAVNTLVGTGAHIPACGSDHRGNVSYSRYNFFPGSVAGTAATIIVDGIDGNTDHISVWGLTVNGNVAPPPLCLTIPSVLTDSTDGTMFTGVLEYDHYHSQVPFQGGNGQVAIGRDQAGNLIVAAEVDHPSDTGPQHAENLIAVARITPGGAITWSVAAHNTIGAGKAIVNGAGTPVGQLVDLGTVTQGNVPGPSVSAPMIDSVGNILFVAAVEIFDSGGGPSDFDSGLVRAVYDPVTFSYTLELLMALGDIFKGVNSATDYQIQFMGIADSNSVSSGGAWSGNINQDAWNGIIPGILDPDDSRTVGGVLVSANIVYDNNGDGMFVPSTGQNGDPLSPDEDYNVVLYVSGQTDCNENGIPDDRDILDGAPDQDGDGVLDECELGPGTPFCFGDGTGNPCPCGNTGGPFEGCQHSAGHGMTIRASGSASVSADDLTMIAEQCPPNNAGIFYVGTIGLPGSPLYSGLQCAAGDVRRFQGGPSNGIGFRSDTNFVAQDPSGIYFVAGITYHFQYWSRDPFNSPCDGFPVSPSAVANFSPGYMVVYTP